jgi:hypothetical protein
MKRLSEYVSQGHHSLILCFFAVQSGDDFARHGTCHVDVKRVKTRYSLTSTDSATSCSSKFNAPLKLHLTSTYSGVHLRGAKCMCCVYVRNYYNSGRVIMLLFVNSRCIHRDTPPSTAAATLVSSVYHNNASFFINNECHTGDARDER